MICWDWCDVANCHEGRLGSYCSDPECTDRLCVLTDERCEDCGGLGLIVTGPPAGVEVARALLADLKVEDPYASPGEFWVVCPGAEDLGALEVAP